MLPRGSGIEQPVSLKTSSRKKEFICSRKNDLASLELSCMTCVRDLPSSNLFPALLLQPWVAGRYMFTEKYALFVKNRLRAPLFCCCFRDALRNLLFLIEIS